MRRNSFLVNLIVLIFFLMYTKKLLQYLIKQTLVLFLHGRCPFLDTLEKTNFVLVRSHLGKITNRNKIK